MRSVSAIAPSSKSRLTPYSADHFAGTTLFDRIARAVCTAGCLPAKELFEAWEVARQTRRRFKGGRVVDLACGHGLLAHIMLILDDTSADALMVDIKLPKSAAKLSAALCEVWPHLAGRVKTVQAPLESVELHSSDVIVASHACGALTDAVLQCAVKANARVSVLPCCHHLLHDKKHLLQGWMDGALALDVDRAMMLERRGFDVHTRCIPAEITPKNRLLLAEPRA